MNTTQLMMKALKQDAHTCSRCGVLHKSPKPGRLALTLGVTAVAMRLEWAGAKQSTGLTRYGLRATSVLNGIGVASLIWGAAVLANHVVTTTPGDDDTPAEAGTPWWEVEV